MKTFDEFVEVFKLLGNSKGCHDTLLKCLENYVCKLYGFSGTKVNWVSFKIFEKKLPKDNEIVDYRYCHHVAVLLDFYKFTLLTHFTCKHISLPLETISKCYYRCTWYNNQWLDKLWWNEMGWVRFPQDIENLVVDYSSDIDDDFVVMLKLMQNTDNIIQNILLQAYNLITKVRQEA